MKDILWKLFTLLLLTAGGCGAVIAVSFFFGLLVWLIQTGFLLAYAPWFN